VFLLRDDCLVLGVRARNVYVSRKDAKNRKDATVKRSDGRR
jgi:hypothetical protein